jgi:endonuclease/exonuclease/phosphatase family metal-dependent hydrolase
MIKIKIFNEVITFLNYVVAMLLLLSYLLPFISPKSIPIFAVLSLLVPVLICLNIVFFIYWLIKLEKQVFLSTSILIMGWVLTTPAYKLSGKNSALNSDLKVMSYNVRMFNHYNWSDDKEILPKMKKLIAANDPDILLLQESHNAKKYEFKYPFKYIKSKTENSKFGMAIYSKFKIINKGSLDLQNTSNNIIYVDIIRNKEKIRIYNLHLQSLKLKNNKKNLSDVSSSNLLKNLKNSFKEQAKQTDVFLNHEQHWQGKKIIAGDFNNTAYSYIYKQISKGKKDAFIEAGKGFGKTFNYPFPMRIDFIFSDDTANINQYKTFSKKYSDHFPILARVNW